MFLLCKPDRRSNRANNGQFQRVIAVAVVLVAWSSHARAGSGTLNSDKKFDLSISVRFDASDATLNALKTRFQEASELLFDATDGQHQFGTIHVCNNSRGGRNADIWILENGSPTGCSDGIDDDGDCPGDTNGDGTVCGRNDAGVDEEAPDGVDNDGDGLVDEDVSCGRSYVPGGCSPGLGTLGCRIMLYADNALTSGNSVADGRHTIVHEFGHYGYGIRDEYVTSTGDTARCLEEPFTPASLMENFWLRSISEFCVDGNHDPDMDTRQSTSNGGESSWATMKRNFPGLNVPGDLPDDAPPAGAETIDWIVLEPESRLVLAIDRSGSMAFPPDKIENARLGAKIFSDLVAEGDKLGVVSFASDVTANFPLTEVAGGTKDAAKAAIDAISPGGTTSIGGGLRAALEQIKSAGDPACQQVIILLTNGQQNTGEHPSSVLPEIKEEGIIVHTIGLGSDTDAALLSSIANETNGRFFFASSPADLQSAFSVLLSESTENGGQITSALSPIQTGETIEIPVPVDALASAVTFLTSWPGQADLDLTLRAPNGSIVTPALAATDPTIRFSSESNSEFYVVSFPQPGPWTMVVLGVSVAGQVELTAQSLAVSKEISLTAAPNKESFRFPEPVSIRANLVAQVNVVGADVRGTVSRPDGSVLPLTLFDTGLPIHDDEAADDGVYSTRFAAYNEDGPYSFQVTGSTESGFLFGGEGISIYPIVGEILPSASQVPAPAFTRSTGFSVTISGVPENQPPICSTGGPYVVDCQGAVTLVHLNATGSTDPDPGDSLSYLWSMDCVEGDLLDPTSATPTLLIETETAGRAVSCSLTLTVTDLAGASSTCSTSVEVTACVPLDIKPRSCPNPLNVKERGVVPAAILGTPDFDVRTIDPTTVRLEGIDPIRWSLSDEAAPRNPIVGREDCFDDCHEEGRDGIPDLTLKFSPQDIVATLGAVENGECLLLRVTGSLIDGTRFNGEDVVLMLKRGDGRVAKLLDGLLSRSTFVRGDSNGDGAVDLSDPIYGLDYLFLGGRPPACDEAADANNDGALDISDVIFELDFLFLGRFPYLESPFPGCAWDTTAQDGLSCESVPACGS